MSAVWGAVLLERSEHKKLPDGIPAAFRRHFSECILDRVEEIETESVYMGCGIQYFTPEAVLEKLPVAAGKVYFNADVVLDNREEIADILGLAAKETAQIPDGELLYRMYSERGEKTLQELLGAYAFAFYDAEKEQTDLVIDAVGDRMIYYTVHQQVLYFSSLLMPLAELTGAGLNDRWLTDFLAMDHLFMINETEETPFENIYRVAPACIVRVTSEGIHKEKYWNPEKTVKPLRLKSDEEYQEVFRKVFTEAVKCRMRGENISALLSGGYDSTAVTAVASRLLRETGKKIAAYTSVPLADYKEKQDEFYVENEREIVEETCRFLGNVEPNYVSMEGVNPWNGHYAGMKRFEMPYKSSLNFLWIPECMRLARQQGSRIMLNGSYGNTTISYENLSVYFNELKRRKRYIRLFREIDLFAKTYGFEAAYAKKQIFGREEKGRGDENKWSSLYKKSFVRPSIVNRTGSDERIGALDRQFGESSKSHKLQRRWMMHDLSLRQIGEIAQKNSLATGILLRDPTRDKRIIEFCMSLPFDQFQKQGEGRRLVSRYLRDYLPPHILVKRYQGRQSADFSYRLSLDWKNIRSEWMQQCRDCADSRYVDAGYEYVQLAKEDDIQKYSQMDLTRHVYTQMVLEYEKQYGKRKENMGKHSLNHEEPLISVIVPVYNCEGTLKRCVDSILAQTYTNFEIWLVNDGSTDGSGEICDYYADMDSRIKVIHKENGGVATARNAALDIMTGEYVGFVDADDYIYPEMYGTLLENMRRHNVQIAGCGVECINHEGKNITDCSDFAFRYYGAEMLETVLGYGRRGALVSISVCNKLFCRELVKGRRFMEVQKYEDLEFTWTMLHEAEGGVFVDRPLYHYEMKQTGLHNRKYGARELREFLAVEERMLGLLKNSDCIRKEGYQSHLAYNYTVLLDWLCGKKGKLESWERYPAKKAMADIRKDMVEVIRSESQRGKKERLIHYVSLYSIGAYKVLRRCQHKVHQYRRKAK